MLSGSDRLAVTRLAAEAARRFGLSIHVVDSPMDESLPPGVRGRRPRAQGYSRGRSAWLFADNLRDLEHAQRVLAHEAVGHLRVEQLVGAGEWPSIVRTIGAIAAGDEPASRVVRWAVDQAQRRYPGEPPAVFAREAVAILAEVGATAPWWDRLIAGVRRTLRGVFPDLAWSDRELRDLVARAARPESGGVPSDDGAVERADRVGGPAAQRLEALVAEEAALADRVDAAFGRGDLATAEVLDERLAVVRAEVDALAAGLGESEADADAEAGLEEELAEAYVATLPLAAAGGRTLADMAGIDPPARLRGILDAHGVDAATQLSDAALLDVAAGAWRARRAVQERRESPLHRYAVDAWHGAVREWEGGAPSLDYVLSGEGCMAYGHGIYFASRREVAEHYRDQMARAPLLLGERRVTTTSIGLAAAERFGESHRAAAIYIAACVEIGYSIDDVLARAEDREDAELIRAVGADLEWIPPSRRGGAMLRVKGRRWTDLSSEERLGLSWLESETRTLARRGVPNAVEEAARVAIERLANVERYRAEWIDGLEARRHRPPPETAQEAEQREAWERLARERVRDSDFLIREYRAAVAIAPEARFVPPPEDGLLYAVTLTPDDDAWLDWDQALVSQSSRVVAALEALRTAGRITGRAAEVMGERCSTGGDVYRAIAASFPANGDQNASRLLREAGVPGVRYLDGPSRRGGGERIPNYVVFDPADVEVRDAFLGVEVSPKARQQPGLAHS